MLIVPAKNDRWDKTCQISRNPTIVITHWLPFPVARNQIFSPNTQIILKKKQCCILRGASLNFCKVVFLRPPVRGGLTDLMVDEDGWTPSWQETSTSVCFKHADAVALSSKVLRLNRNSLCKQVYVGRLFCFGDSLASLAWVCPSRDTGQVTRSPVCLSNEAYKRCSKLNSNSFQSLDINMSKTPQQDRN